LAPGEPLPAALVRSTTRIAVAQGVSRDGPTWPGATAKIVREMMPRAHFATVYAKNGA
jgi:hypothetical protein